MGDEMSLNDIVQQKQMASLTQSPPSVSSGGSPERYHGQGPLPSGPNIFPHKNTYRHIPGHAQGAYNGMMPNGTTPNIHQYPAHMTIQGGQFYPSIPAQSTAYMPPVYGAGNLQEPHPYYYYQGPNGSWTVQQPMHVYPHAYTNSPPSTPPQPQIPYGYPMLAPTHDYHPPSPPQVSYNNSNNNTNNITNNNQVPCLDHRRNSWSSSGATDTPATPFPSNVDPAPAIVGESGITENRGKDIGLEQLLLAGPPLPRPIPAVYASGAITLAQTLDNPTNTTNVYIRGLPPDTDDDKLYEMTCRFGAVVSHKAIMDTEHGTCKGYVLSITCIYPVLTVLEIWVCSLRKQIRC
jgi:hypothetical protein